MLNHSPVFVGHNQNLLCRVQLFFLDDSHHLQLFIKWQMYLFETPLNSSFYHFVINVGRRINWQSTFWTDLVRKFLYQFTEKVTEGILWDSFWMDSTRKCSWTLQKNSEWIPNMIPWESVWLCEILHGFFEEIFFWMDSIRKIWMSPVRKILKGEKVFKRHSEKELAFCEKVFERSFKKH